MTFTHDGKLIHSVAFTVLAASAILGWREHKAKLIVLLTFLGVTIEVVQGAQLIGRGPDVFDWVLAWHAGSQRKLDKVALDDKPAESTRRIPRSRDRLSGGDGTRFSGNRRLHAGGRLDAGEIMRSLRRLVAADNMTQKENAKVEAKLAIAPCHGPSRRPFPRANLNEWLPQLPRTAASLSLRPNVGRKSCGEVFQE